MTGLPEAVGSDAVQPKKFEVLEIKGTDSKLYQRAIGGPVAP